MSDNLRDALEKLCDSTDGEFADNPMIRQSGSVPTEQLRDLLAAHPTEPVGVSDARDYEPGTRFLVIEIPPAASDEVADEITEKVFKHAAELDEQYDGPWDLFIYRQHNAPPAGVPALPAAGVSDEAVEAAEQAMRGHDCNEIVNRNIPYLARTALEAAQPFMQPQVVAAEISEEDLKIAAEQADEWQRDLPQPQVVASRAVHEAAAALETAEQIATVIEEYADDLEPPTTSEWLEQRSWFKGLLHEVAARAREIGGEQPE